MDALYILAGAAMTLATIFAWERLKPREEKSRPEAETEKSDEKSEKMREQWSNFLSYDGSDQNS